VGCHLATQAEVDKIKAMLESACVLEQT
jgi:hypothetical protein